MLGALPRALLERRKYLAPTVLRMTKPPVSGALHASQSVMRSYSVGVGSGPETRVSMPRNV